MAVPDLGVGKAIDTATNTVMNFEKFTWFQRIAILALLAWAIYDFRYVIMPRLDCKWGEKIPEACEWIGESYK